MTLVMLGAGVFFVLGAAAMYSPVYLFDHSDRMSGAELGRRYPQFAWMRVGYPLLTLGLFAIAIWFGTDLFADGERIFYMGGALFFSVPILNGAIGLLTGVCPFFGEFRYLYVRDNHVLKVSLKLIVFGVLGLAASWVLPIVLPHVKIF